MGALFDWKYGKWIAYSLHALWIPVLFFVFLGAITPDSWTNLYADTVHETIIQYYPEINYMASFAWVFGVRRNKTVITKGALGLWGINIILWIVAIFSYIIVGDKYHIDYPERPLILLAAFLYMVANFVVAMLCFQSMQDAERKQSETDAKNQTPELAV